MVRGLDSLHNTKRSYGYALYMEMSDISEGFDVCPGGDRLCGGIVEFNDSRPKSMAKASEVAKYAVDHHNKTQNSDLEFVNLVKANGQVVGGYMFYLTLRARRPTHKRATIYQAKVWKTISNELIVSIFRRRPKHYPFKLPRQRHKKPKAKEAKPLSIPKRAFIRFVSDVRKLPELSNMRYHDVVSLASRKWQSMSIEDKVRNYRTRSLKYEDIADLMPALCE